MYNRYSRYFKLIKEFTRVFVDFNVCSIRIFIKEFYPCIIPFPTKRTTTINFLMKQ